MLFNLGSVAVYGQFGCLLVMCHLSPVCASLGLHHMERIKLKGNINGLSTKSMHAACMCLQNQAQCLHYFVIQNLHCILCLFHWKVEQVPGCSKTRPPPCEPMVGKSPPWLMSCIGRFRLIVGASPIGTCYFCGKRSNLPFAAARFSRGWRTMCRRTMGQASTPWMSSTSSQWLRMPGRWVGLWCEIQMVCSATCSSAMLGRKVSLNFWPKWGTVGQGVCKLLGAACWPTLKTWILPPSCSRPSRRLLQLRCRLPKLCWWCQTGKRASTLDFGAWIKPSLFFVAFQDLSSLLEKYVRGECTMINHDKPMEFGVPNFPLFAETSSTPFSIRGVQPSLPPRCAYEAYLAQEEGKTILIAHSSNLHQILAALRGMALAAIFVASVGIVATLLNLGQTYGVPALACLVVGSSLVIHDDVCRRVMYLLGEILCWTQVTHGFVNFFDLYSAEARVGKCSWRP